MRKNYSQNLVENGDKDEIEDLNKRINRLKVEERKSEREYNKSQRRKRKRSDELSAIFKDKSENENILSDSKVFIFLLHGP